jgi:hypothetical protein
MEGSVPKKAAVAQSCGTIHGNHSGARSYTVHPSTWNGLRSIESELRVSVFSEEKGRKALFATLAGSGGH